MRSWSPFPHVFLVRRLFYKRESLMFRPLRRLIESDDGATAVEYAVMLALIVVACLGSVFTLATATADSFDDSSTELSSVLGS